MASNANNMGGKRKAINGTVERKKSENGVAMTKNMKLISSVIWHVKATANNRRRERRKHLMENISL